MYTQLKETNTKPKIYSKYTAKELWVNEHRSEQMLNYHLNKEVDISSNNANYIKSTVKFIHKKFQLNKDKNINRFWVWAWSLYK